MRAIHPRLLFCLLSVTFFATSGKSAPTDLHPNNNYNREAKVVVGPTGPTGDTGPSGPAGSDGIGLRLRTFKVGNTYYPGEYVFSRAPNDKHDAMFAAQKRFQAQDIPANELENWVELSKGEKGDMGPTGATGTVAVSAGNISNTSVCCPVLVKRTLIDNIF